MTHTNDTYTKIRTFAGNKLQGVKDYYGNEFFHRNVEVGFSLSSTRTHVAMLYGIFKHSDAKPEDLQALGLSDTEIKQVTMLSQPLKSMFDYALIHKDFTPLEIELRVIQSYFDLRYERKIRKGIFRRLKKLEKRRERIRKFFNKHGVD